MESQRGELVEGKKGGAIDVVVRLQLTPCRSGTVDDDEIGSVLVLPPSDDVEQAGDLYLQPGLLAALTSRRLGRILVKIDKTRREGPHSPAGLHTAADEEYLALPLNDHASGHLVISEDKPVTIRAETPHASKRLPILSA